MVTWDTSWKWAPLVTAALATMMVAVRYTSEKGATSLSKTEVILPHPRSSQREREVDYRFHFKDSLQKYLENHRCEDRIMKLNNIICKELPEVHPCIPCMKEFDADALMNVSNEADKVAGFLKQSSQGNPDWSDLEEQRNRSNNLQDDLKTIEAELDDIKKKNPDDAKAFTYYNDIKVMQDQLDEVKALLDNADDNCLQSPELEKLVNNTRKIGAKVGAMVVHIMLEKINDTSDEAKQLKGFLKSSDDGIANWTDLDNQLNKVEVIDGNLGRLKVCLNDLKNKHPNDTKNDEYLKDVKSMSGNMDGVKTFLENAEKNCLQSPSLPKHIEDVGTLQEKIPEIIRHVGKSRSLSEEPADKWKQYDPDDLDTARDEAEKIRKFLNDSDNRKADWGKLNTQRHLTNKLKHAIEKAKDHLNDLKKTKPTDTQMDKDIEDLTKMTHDLEPVTKFLDGAENHCLRSLDLKKYIENVGDIEKKLPGIKDRIQDAERQPEGTDTNDTINRLNHFLNDTDHGRPNWEDIGTLINKTNHLKKHLEKMEERLNDIKQKNPSDPRAKDYINEVKKMQGDLDDLKGFLENADENCLQPLKEHILKVAVMKQKIPEIQRYIDQAEGTAKPDHVPDDEAEKLKNYLGESDLGKANWTDLDNQLERTKNLSDDLSRVKDSLEKILKENRNDTNVPDYIKDVEKMRDNLAKVKTFLDDADKNCLQSKELKEYIDEIGGMQDRLPEIKKYIADAKPRPKPGSTRDKAEKLKIYLNQSDNGKADWNAIGGQLEGTKDLNDILETVQKRLDKAMKWDHHNAKTPGYIEDVEKMRENMDEVELFLKNADENCLQSPKLKKFIDNIEIMQKKLPEIRKHLKDVLQRPKFDHGGDEAAKLKDYLNQANNGNPDWKDLDNQFGRTQKLGDELHNVKDRLKELKKKHPEDPKATQYIEDVAKMNDNLDNVKKFLDNADNNCLQSPDLKSFIDNIDVMAEKLPIIKQYLDEAQKPPKPRDEAIKLKQYLNQSDTGQPDWNDIGNQSNRTKKLTDDLEKIKDKLDQLQKREPDDPKLPGYKKDVKKMLDNLQRVQIFLDDADNNCLQSPELKKMMIELDEMPKKLSDIRKHIRDSEKRPKADRVGDEVEKLKQYLNESDRGNATWKEVDDQTERARGLITVLDTVEDRLRKIGESRPNDARPPRYINNVTTMRHTLQEVKTFLDNADDNCLQSADLKELINKVGDIQKQLPKILRYLDETPVPETVAGEDVNKLKKYLNDTIKGDANWTDLNNQLNRTHGLRDNLGKLRDALTKMKENNPRDKKTEDYINDVRKMDDNLNQTEIFLGNAESNCLQSPDTGVIIKKLDDMAKKIPEILAHVDIANERNQVSAADEDAEKLKKYLNKSEHGDADWKHIDNNRKKVQRLKDKVQSVQERLEEVEKKNPEDEKIPIYKKDIQKMQENLDNVDRFLDQADQNCLQSPKLKEYIDNVNRMQRKLPEILGHIEIAKAEPEKSYRDQTNDIYIEALNKSGDGAAVLRKFLDQVNRSVADWDEIDGQFNTSVDIRHDLGNVEDGLKLIKREYPNDTQVDKYLKEIKTIRSTLDDMEWFLDNADDNCLQSPKIKKYIAEVDKIIKMRPEMIQYIQAPRNGTGDKKKDLTWKDPEDYKKDIHESKKKLKKVIDYVDKVQNGTHEKTKAGDMIHEIDNISKIIDDIGGYIDHEKKDENNPIPDKEVNEVLNCTDDVLKDARKFLESVKSGEPPKKKAEDIATNLKDTKDNMNKLRDHIKDLDRVKKDPSKGNWYGVLAKNMTGELDHIYDYIDKTHDNQTTKKDAEKMMTVAKDIRSQLHKFWELLKYADKNLPEYNKTATYIKMVERDKDNVDKIIIALTDVKDGKGGEEHLWQHKKDIAVLQDDLIALKDYIDKIQDARKRMDLRNSFTKSKQTILADSNTIHDLLQPEGTVSKDLENLRKQGENVTDEDIKKAADHDQKVKKIQGHLDSARKILDKVPRGAPDSQAESKYYEKVDNIKDDITHSKVDLEKKRYTPRRLKSIKEYMEEVEDQEDEDEGDEDDEDGEQETEPSSVLFTTATTPKAVTTTKSIKALTTKISTTTETVPSTYDPCHFENMNKAYCTCRTRERTVTRPNATFCQDGRVCMFGNCTVSGAGHLLDACYDFMNSPDGYLQSVQVDDCNTWCCITRGRDPNIQVDCRFLKLDPCDTSGDDDYEKPSGSSDNDPDNDDGQDDYGD